MAYKIGEAARKVGCKVETVRFYEQAGLLPEPARSEGNFRLYSDTHLEQLRFIRHCRSLDIPLDDIRTLLQLKERPAENCTDINQVIDEQIVRVDAQLESLKQLRASLLTLRSQCVSGEAENTCDILRELMGCSCHDLQADKQIR
ncbi:Cd(II)/Pb(II)-responsive transcriptional regulator [Microbulbifer sp. VAAF005]|uniref:Cd(II)/Pb(II)-responsive transcriptional regulator n=1 Tax=Microbulbifer sp. VAAF005 TaxID=3034230 RepID=UPI0024AE8513|nr:Cd(II)/Pb(II)-responsive transcriptional regulator [Microbulbifer sp. VAAF005]WHI47352.1 Cd(II)/Pb(II)-responsive transcriptional regulator [Microbulbifer sp. VAAF005]